MCLLTDSSWLNNEELQFDIGIATSSTKSMATKLKVNQSESAMTDLQDQVFSGLFSLKTQTASLLDNYLRTLCETSISLIHFTQLACANLTFKNRLANNSIKQFRKRILYDMNSRRRRRRKKNHSRFILFIDCFQSYHQAVKRENIIKWN